MEQRMDNGLGSLIEEVETDERKQRELALQKKKARFQESLQELAAIVVQFSEELGEDNEMTVMMLDFFNTCLELQQVTKLLEGVSKGIKALTDVLGVISVLVRPNHFARFARSPRILCVYNIQTDAAVIAVRRGLWTECLYHTQDLVGGAGKVQPTVLIIYLLAIGRLRLVLHKQLSIATFNQ